LSNRPATAISEEQFKTLFNGLMKWPDDFKPLRKVEKLLQDKVKLFEAEQKVDWATGELLAYSSLLGGSRCSHERPGCEAGHLLAPSCRYL
jgi:2-oxoglutarate dehydrogenase complex dehydrogenase (E1) component-like enzyme